MFSTLNVSISFSHTHTQALVARGSSVTILNSQGETPAQAAHKSGHSVCVGYLVVVETCVSLAQQVVSLKSELKR